MRYDNTKLRTAYDCYESNYSSYTRAIENDRLYNGIIVFRQGSEIDWLGYAWLIMPDTHEIENINVSDYAFVRPGTIDYTRVLNRRKLLRRNPYAIQL